MFFIASSPAKDRPTALRFILALSLLMFLEPGGFVGASEDFVILYMNDPHAHYTPYSVPGIRGLSGGFAKAQTVLKQERTTASEEGSRVISLLAGDLLMGTPFSTVFRGELGALLMNRMAFDAMVVGNHEFDYGITNLMENVRATLRLPLLSANIRASSGRHLFEKSHEMIFPPHGSRVVIFGLTTPETPIMTMPQNVQGMIFDDPVQTAMDFAKDLRPEDIVIAVTHLGVNEDKRLAMACPLIDVIIGGHSHTALFEPLLVNGVVICQAGAYAEYVGRLKVTVERGRVTDFQGKLIHLVPDIAEDEDVKAVLKTFSGRMDRKLREAIGRTEVFLEGGRSQVRSDTPSTFGNLVAYVMAQRVRAEAGLINAGAIRSGIDVGEISRESIYTALPFPNTVVKVGLRGQDLADILQRSLDLVEGSGGKLHSFGITYSDSYRSRSIHEIGGEKYDPQRVYLVATNNFLAAGGDGYGAFHELGMNAVESYDLVSDLFIEFMLEKKLIDHHLLTGLRIDGG